MDTTKERVLLVAPELFDLLQNSKQIDLIEVTDVIKEENYIVTINNIDYVYTATATPTKENIVTGLMNAITAELELKDNLDGSFRISKNAEYSIATGTKLELTRISNYKNADTLFDMYLDDVKAELTDVITSAKEKCQRYLIAHLLTLHGQNTGNTKSESVGRASVTYAGGDLLDPDMLSRTKYGAEFWRLYKKSRILRGI